MQTPKIHQEEAIKACSAGLKTPGSRGQCIMACGTGKSLVGHEVAKTLEAKRVLVLVPSLLLVNQMIRYYKAQGSENILCVCSDDSAGGDDAIHISVRELEAENTTDVNRVQEFLSGPGQRVVVSTYQSLRPLSEVMSALEFDLAIFDEAHKTAGVKSKLFAHGLTDDSVKCARRLFMTATPRHAALKEDGSEEQVFAMNDPKVYGPVLYSLPMRAAIEAGIIDDYRVVIAMVTKKDAAKLRDQAVRVAIDRAREAYGINKVFAFHARIADSRDFVLGATSTLKGMQLYHVDGTQTATERELKLKAFANADAALVSNARCLTEGVDLPAADMVAFLSPKRNPIDIVQATGRVLRTHPSKAMGGTVFLPVFVEDGDDEEEAIMASKWSTAYEVLQALREQDEPLAAALAKCARGESDLPGNVHVVDCRSRRRVGTGMDLSELSDGMRQAIRVKVIGPFQASLMEKLQKVLLLVREGKSIGEITADPQLYWSLLNARRRSIRNVQIVEILKEIERLAPNLFQRRQRGTGRLMDLELVDRAKAGEPKPLRSSNDPAERRLAKRLAGNSRLWRKIIPEWFTTNYVDRQLDTAARKREILDYIKKYGRRPRVTSSNRYEKRLAGQTDRFCSPASRVYDEEFRSKVVGLVKKVRKPTSVKLLELLRMARAGEPRPSQSDPHTRALANTLSHATCRSDSDHYKAEFDQEIRTLAPHWFAKKGNGKP